LNAVIEAARYGKVKGYLLCVDFQGAFDTVRHDFIWQAMKEMNVGSCLIQNLQTLYKNSRSAVLNFNTQTNFFYLERSCRQGDPVSPYLFVIAIEVLVRRLKRQVKPIKIRDSFEVGSVVFADDLSHFVPDKDSMSKSLDIISDFKTASGLQINLQKSEVLELSGDPLESCPLHVKSTVKITGRFFALDKRVEIQFNSIQLYSRVPHKIIISIHNIT
jgi:hypothetical protein